MHAQSRKIPWHETFGCDPNPLGTITKTNPIWTELQKDIFENGFASLHWHPNTTFVGFVGCDNPDPSPWRKRFLVLDQWSVGAALEPVLWLSKRFEIRHRLWTCPQAALVVPWFVYLWNRDTPNQQPSTSFVLKVLGFFPMEMADKRILHLHNDIQYLYPRINRAC